MGLYLLFPPFILFFDFSCKHLSFCTMPCSNGAVNISALGYVLDVFLFSCSLGGAVIIPFPSSV